MKFLSLLATLVALAFTIFTFSAPVALAVDNSISPLCNPATPGTEGYRRAGGFCDAVANNQTLLPRGSGNWCEFGKDPITGECLCAPKPT